MGHIMELIGDLKREAKLEEAVNRIGQDLNELKTRILRDPPLPMAEAGVMEPKIVEVFSPPRVAPVMNHAAGHPCSLSLDLRTVDVKGRRWDFDDECCQMRA